MGVLDLAHSSAAKPLAEHVEDFVKTIRAKDNTAGYVRFVLRRVERFFTECGFMALADITAQAVRDRLKTWRDAGMAPQTSNHYLAAVKEFTRWLVREERLGRDPLAVLAPLPASAIRSGLRHERRALTLREVHTLLAAAEAGPERFGMAGPERALAYRLVLETGLRAGELEGLAAGAFRLPARRSPCLPLAKDQGAGKQTKNAKQTTKTREAESATSYSVKLLEDTPAGFP
jgi:integrase